jgi:HK97 family phage major capsid protein
MADQNKGLSRSFKVERNKIDVEKRTIELSFASETPIERWGENEVLGHSAGEYDFSRIKDGTHPLLLGHSEQDPNSQIGVVESAEVRDGKSRAIVRFSKRKDADEVFQDVIDGIRQNISVGYDRTGIVSSVKDKDTNAVTTRYRWMPIHIAIVPVPADTAVGVGRGRVDSPQKPNADEQSKNNMPDAPNTLTVDEPKIRLDERGKAFAEDRNRAKEITDLSDELAKKHGAKNDGTLETDIRKLQSEAIATGMSKGDFQLRALTLVTNATPAKPILLRDIDHDGAKKYSLMRGIQFALAAREKGGASVPSEKDCYEGEMHAEVMRIAKQRGGLGFDPGPGFQVPADAPMRSHTPGGSRAQFMRDVSSQAGIFAQGGAFIPTELRLPIIELLRNKEILSELGIFTMAGLQGPIVIPRQTAAATAYSVPEIGQLADTGQLLDQITLTPHRVGATQKYSRLFVMQSSPDAEAFLRDDLLTVIGLKWDFHGIAGQGAGDEPLGLFNSPGIGSIVLGGSPTYAQMVAMETAIRNANVRDPLAYISTPNTKGNMKVQAEVLATATTTISGAQNALWKPNDTVNSYPAHETNQVPFNKIALGAWRNLIRGIWGGMTVIVDVFTSATTDQVRITFNTYGDYALRHPQAFVVSADAGNQ